MSKYWSAHVHDLHPYVPGEQPQHQRLVKLNTNENPYPPSPAVVEAILSVLGEDGAVLRLYPDPESVGLRDVIAEHFNLKSEQVFVGNGSDEVLAHAFDAFFRNDKPLFFPDISYSFYPVYCGLYGIPFESIALDENLQLRAADYRKDCGGVIFPNPNAPTGSAISLAAVEDILQSNAEQVVIVDEAYVDFGADSAVALIDRYPNLLVVQTTSKSRSMAGSRVGYALGQAHLIEGLVRVKDSFNSYPLDKLAQVAARASFLDDAYFRACCARVVNEREALCAGLDRLGFMTLPSSANFVFTRHLSVTAKSLMAGLREQGVIVRHFDKPRISEYLRITVGTAEQNAILLEVLAELV